MIERTQPVVTGVNAKGELIWTKRAMARWQMEMFRVRYYGDFMVHWMKRQMLDTMGIDWDSEVDGGVPSMTLSPFRGRLKKSKLHAGD